MKHLFCLHFVFLPRINAALESFTESWNNHSISTEHGMTPNQLFIQGALQQNMVPVVPNVPSHGVGGTQPNPQDRVTVPRIKFSPCTLLKQQLDQIDPLGMDYFDCTSYLHATDIVGQHLTTGCYNCSE